MKHQARSFRSRMQYLLAPGLVVSLMGAGAAFAADKSCAPATNATCAAAAKSGEAGKAAKAKPASDAEGWECIFDGKTMDGWRISDFAAKGEVKVEPGFRGGPGAIVINMTDELRRTTCRG
jgi:hypothetical protein